MPSYGPQSGDLQIINCNMCVTSSFSRNSRTASSAPRVLYIMGSCSIDYSLAGGSSETTYHAALGGIEADGYTMKASAAVWIG